MVMETPSALWIGREFVRQYYTVLNQAPIYLHRFYSQDSSFVHGGPEKQVSVTGQQDIHERIMQLNFRDCHARIRQVDSQSTLGQGVVVQVTGELSNAGQPMRRFMQTFVLAHQTPLKYYVRNDIFRYQDEVFTEEEEEDSDKAVREEDQAETPAAEATSGPGLVTAGEEATVASSELTNCATSPATPTCTATRGPYYEPQVGKAQEVVRNGTAHLPSENEHSPQGSGTPSSLESSPPEVGITPTSSGSASLGWKEEESPTPAATAATAVNTSQVNHQAPVETKTYANMVSKNSTPLSSASFTCLSPAPFGGAAPTSHAPTSLAAPPTSRFGGESLGSGLAPRGGDQRGPRSQGRPPRSMPPGGPSPRRSDGPPASRGEGSPLGAVDESSGQLVGGPRPGPKAQYPDTQQVFVGNLPHSVTEEQVRERFEHFGHVIDFRINAKPSTKMTAAGKTVPNCGFVVFDSPDAVQAVLKSTPIHINDTRVNVEEKKTKQKLATEGRGGGPPFSSGGGAPRGGGMMQRGGGRGNGRGGAFSRVNRNPPGLGVRH